MQQVLAKSGTKRGTPCNAPDPYQLSDSVSRCLAEGQGNGNQHHPMGCMA